MRRKGKEMPHQHAPVSVLYAYAHEDEALRDQLAVHLRQLQREGHITEWHDRQILAGTDYAKTMDAHLATASLILLLISPDFLASDYCYQIEMQRAMERHKLGEARIIPIILRPCDWQYAPFAHLQVLPPDGNAVTTWSNLDEAFLVITKELRRVLENMPPSLTAVPTLSALERKNRSAFLDKIEDTWITHFLDQSLEQQVWIELGLQERRNLLPNPWHVAVQELGQTTPHPLPAGTTIEGCVARNRKKTR